MGLLSAVSVLYESKIKLLADPYCVGDGNSLPEPWGICSAGDRLCVSVYMCLMVVRERAGTCQQERVEQAPRCMSQQPSHQPF